MHKSVTSGVPPDIRLLQCKSQHGAAIKISEVEEIVRQIWTKLLTHLTSPRKGKELRLQRLRQTTKRCHNELIVVISYSYGIYIKQSEEKQPTGHITFPKF